MSEQNFINPEPIIFPENINEQFPTAPQPEEVNPVGESPFPSWTWVSNNIGIGFWSPPIAQPSINGKTFLWNEPDLSWYYKDEETSSWVKYIEE